MVLATTVSFHQSHRMTLTRLSTFTYCGNVYLCDGGERGAVRPIHIHLPDCAFQWEFMKICIDLVLNAFPSEWFCCARRAMIDVQFFRALLTNMVANDQYLIHHHIDWNVIINEASTDWQTTNDTFRCTHKESLWTILRNRPSGNWFFPGAGNYVTSNNAETQMNFRFNSLECQNIKMESIENKAILTHAWPYDSAWKDGCSFCNLMFG